MRSLFLAVLLAPRPVLPDVQWVAAMYLLLYPRDAQLWSKFAAIVGADVDRTEWEKSLGELVAKYAVGQPSISQGMTPTSWEQSPTTTATGDEHHHHHQTTTSMDTRTHQGDPVGHEPRSVLLRAGMGLAHSIKDASINTKPNEPSSSPVGVQRHHLPPALLDTEGSSSTLCDVATAPTHPTNTVRSSSPSVVHHPMNPTTTATGAEALGQRRGWPYSLSLSFSQPHAQAAPLPTTRGSPDSADSSPEMGVSMNSGGGLSPGMGGCMLLPFNENLTTYSPTAYTGSPSSLNQQPVPGVSGETSINQGAVLAGTSATIPTSTSNRSRRSRAHSRGSSLPSPGLDDLREEPEPLEAVGGYAAPAPMTSSSSDESDNESESSGMSVRHENRTTLDRLGRTQYAPTAKLERQSHQSDAEEDQDELMGHQRGKAASLTTTQQSQRPASLTVHRCSNCGTGSHHRTCGDPTLAPHAAHQPTNSDHGRAVNKVDEDAICANDHPSSPWSSSPHQKSPHHHHHRQQLQKTKPPKPASSSYPTWQENTARAQVDQWQHERTRMQNLSTNPHTSQAAAGGGRDDQLTSPLLQHPFTAQVWHSNLSESESESEAPNLGHEDDDDDDDDR